MNALELLVVCPSLDDLAIRGVVLRLSRRYLVEAATGGAPTTGAGGEIDVRTFAEPDGLAEFLHHEHARYRAIAFLSYASPLTGVGLPLVPERAILLPLADTGADLRAPRYRVLFHLPRAIGYRDAAERDRVQAALRNEQVPYELLRLDRDDEAADTAFDRLVATALYA